MQTYVAVFLSDTNVYNEFYYSLWLYLIYAHGRFIRYAARLEAPSIGQQKIISETVARIQQEIGYLIHFDPVQKKVISDLPNKKTLHEILMRHIKTEKEFAVPEDFAAFVPWVINIHRDYLIKLGVFGKSLEQMILRLANQDLFAQVEEQLVSLKTKNLIVLNTSHRQTQIFDADQNQRNGSGFFLDDILVLKQFLQSLVLKDGCVNLIEDKFNLPHFYNGKDYLFDHSKLTIYYAALHHLAATFKAEMVNVIAFENDKNIKMTLANTFLLVPKLFSRTLNFSFAEPSDNANALPRRIIGEGNIDYNIAGNLKWMLTLCQRQVIKFDEPVDMAKELRNKNFIELFLCSRDLFPRLPNNLINRAQFFQPPTPQKITEKQSPTRRCKIM